MNKEFKGYTNLFYLNIRKFYHKSVKKKTKKRLLPQKGSFFQARMWNMIFFFKFGITFLYVSKVSDTGLQRISNINTQWNSGVWTRMASPSADRHHPVNLLTSGTSKRPQKQLDYNFLQNGQNLSFAHDFFCKESCMIFFRSSLRHISRQNYSGKLPIFVFAFSWKLQTMWFYHSIS